MSQADWPRFMLRLPPDLKRWVDAEAKRNGASQNSEVIRCIRDRMDRIVGPGRGEGEDGNGVRLGNEPVAAFNPAITESDDEHA